MIRITGGRLKGRMIDSPPDTKGKGVHVRPTSGMVRESLFNQLQWRIAGSRFLDLFAGSGLMGFEANSRGAAFVMAVEKHSPHCRLIAANVEQLGGFSPDSWLLRSGDVEDIINRPCPEEEAFDIVFLDPPYGFSKLEALIKTLKQKGWVRPNGVIIAEQSRQDPELPGMERRHYGDTVLSIAYLNPEPTEESETCSGV